jgi:beta-aspartyl-dipeptidase (metallo-type)
VEKIDFSVALQIITSNVADVLWLKNKGRIAPGKDADVVVIDADYKIVHLTALGNLMTSNYNILRKGSYES